MGSNPQEHSMSSSGLVANQHQPPSRKPNKWLYNGTVLILIAFSVAFFPRIFCSITGAPSALNHAHLLIVPCVTAIILITARPQDRRQIEIVELLLAGLTILLGVTLASTLLNKAGLVNAVLSFLMLGGPFMLLASIICLPMSSGSFLQFRQWIIRSSFANMILAFSQWPLLKFGKITAGGLNAGDGMAGVFFVSGAGNYVSATVSVYFGLYYLAFAKAAPPWLRISTLLAALFQIQLSDSKQVLFALFCGGILLVVVTMKELDKALTYAVGIIILLASFYWAVQNIEALSAFQNYAAKENVWGLDGEAARIKPIAFKIIPTYFESPLNWLFGLGPGHTVGRLGGWLLKENWAILGPLGATTHPASAAAVSAYYSNWLAVESTIFSPLFGWAGIWGDLGFFGLGAYLLLGFIVWHYLCDDMISKLIVLSIAMFGFIFTQMEEPGFMLYSAALIGLRWQERRFASLRSAG